MVKGGGVVTMTFYRLYGNKQNLFMEKINILDPTIQNVPTYKITPTYTISRSVSTCGFTENHSENVTISYHINKVADDVRITFEREDIPKHNLQGRTKAGERRGEMRVGLLVYRQGLPLLW